MLKRHVKHHSQDSTNLTLIACSSCHERKLKCDDSIPCRPCASSSIECRRIELGGESRVSIRLDINDGNGSGNGDEIDRMHENDRSPPDETRESSEASESGTTLQSNEYQQSYFQSMKDKWSLLFTPTKPNAPSLNDPISSGPAQRAVDPTKLGRVEAVIPIPTIGNSPFLLPTINRPQIERVPSMSRFEMDQGNRTAPLLVSQSPTSLKSSREDHMIALQSYLDKDPVDIERLVQVYFAEIHPYWPILHSPTFDIVDTSQLLLGAMIMLASWLANESDHTELAPLISQDVTAALLVRKCVLSRLI